MMKFEKRNFMGIELDVLVGHPEHDLLFVATQVARSAGLKDPSNAVSVFRTNNAGVTGAFQWRGVLASALDPIQDHPTSRVLQANSWLASEGWVYRMLMRGDSKAAESFRSWIADEVVPTIRKTGQYNAAESSDPIAVGIMDELKLLRGELVELKEIVKALGLPTVAAKALPSPYEGTTKGTVHYHCDARMIRDAAETLGLSRPVVDKLIPRVVLRLEAVLSTKWNGAPLEFEASTTQRKWTVYPTNWLKAQLSRQFIRETLQEVVNEAIK